jgi:hypothetical protein
MASILDETDKICEDYVNKQIHQELQQTMQWLADNVEWGVFDEMEANNLIGNPDIKEYTVDQYNVHKEKFAYTYIRVISKSDHHVYIKPLSNRPLRLVGYFKGEIPEYIRFDSPTKVRIHAVKDVRADWENDVEGDTWIASCYYSEKQRNRLLFNHD